ncbi:ABC transporter permease [Lactobacillus nasalidis]|uniref:ABC transporter permease n=1 Tax=Lactobacillus nasalidis TaxID=2797258 RepID=A0ABQ3W5Z1_9LACO|nr:FtsX-like permease family protein [Lactobacillus nasalidis]GHW01970.1 ABC transporter permease [Lactobacillus nasalidis]
MIFKLSMTGMKSRLKDYLVLFSGLSAASMIFYMFLTLAANPAFLKSSVAGQLTMAATKFIFGFGTVLLGLLVLVYLAYANSFLLSMRKRDYGMYMMLGAKSGKIGQLIFAETLVTGLLATGIGIVLGVGLTELVSALMVKQLGLTLAHFNPLYLPAVLWTLLFFIVLFFLAASWNAVKLTKTTLINLLKEDQKPSSLKSRPVLRTVQALVGLLSMAIGYWAMGHVADLQLKAIPIALVTIVLGSFFIFDAFFVAVIDFLRKKHGFLYKGMRPYTLGQLKFRLHGYTRILSAISIMLALALGAITVGINFNNLKSAMTDVQYYDFVLVGKQEKLADKLEKIGVQEKVSYSYKADKKAGVLYVKKSEIDKTPLKIQEYSAASTQKKKAIDKQGRIYQTVEVSSSTLTGKQTGKASRYAAEAASLFPEDSSKGFIALSDAAFAKKKLSSQTLTFYKVKEFAKNNQQLLKLLKQEMKQFNKKSVTYFYLQFTKPVLYQQIAAMCSGFEFMGLFLGLSFLMMLASTLMFKILSAATSDKTRYQMLYKLGSKTSVLKAAIGKEIAILFVAPAVLGSLDVLFGLQFFKLLLPDPYYKLWIPFLAFFLLYLVYYLVTVKLYQGIVLQDTKQD